MHSKHDPAPLFPNYAVMSSSCNIVIYCFSHFYHNTTFTSNHAYREAIVCTNQQYAITEPITLQLHPLQLLSS